MKRVFIDFCLRQVSAVSMCVPPQELWNEETVWLIAGCSFINPDFYRDRGNIAIWKVGYELIIDSL